ncbi:MAG: tetratricopeptide repeat protein, partial [Bacteroidia bacterium]|nr:tetratricopeptide repeat protein [Bacteroidia bacterium]
MNVEEKMGWPHWLVIAGGATAIILLSLADRTTLNRQNRTTAEAQNNATANAPKASGVDLSPWLSGVKSAEDSLAALKAALADAQTMQNPELFQSLNAAATAAAESIAARRPEDLEAQVEAAVFLVSSSNPMNGIQRLKQVLEKNPRHYRANLELGKFSMMTGQWDKARERLQTAANVDPGRWEAHFYLGFLMQNQENFT